MFVSNSVDETDPGDWENTRFPKLKELDSMLRCEICKEFLNSPVLTTCGHIFCSLCARRAIQQTRQCPLCSEETYESGLKKVLLLESIVDWFNGNQKSLIGQLQKLDNERLVIEIGDSQSEDEGHGMASKLDTTGKTDKTQCPVCNQFMSLDELQANHIDECLLNESEPKTKKRKVGLNDLLSNGNEKKITKQSSNHPQLQTKNISKTQRLPNLDSSLSTNKIKEKLTSLRLPTNGNRSQIEQRMKEYITIYNANLDSLNPVDNRVLRSRLLQWENLMNRSQRSKGDSATPEGDHDNSRCSKDREDWKKSNSNAYASLIQQAKSNRKPQTVPNNDNKNDDIEKDSVHIDKEACS